MFSLCTAEAASLEMPSHTMTTEDTSDPHKPIGQHVRCELPHYLLENREFYQALQAEFLVLRLVWHFACLLLIDRSDVSSLAKKCKDDHQAIDA